MWVCVCPLHMCIRVISLWTKPFENKRGKEGHLLLKGLPQISFINTCCAVFTWLQTVPQSLIFSIDSLVVQIKCTTVNWPPITHPFLQHKAKWQLVWGEVSLGNCFGRGGQTGSAAALPSEATRFSHHSENPWEIDCSSCQKLWFFHIVNLHLPSCSQAPELPSGILWKQAAVFTVAFPSFLLGNVLQGEIMCFLNWSGWWWQRKRCSTSTAGGGSAKSFCTFELDKVPDYCLFIWYTVWIGYNNAQQCLSPFVGNFFTQR